MANTKNKKQKMLNQIRSLKVIETLEDFFSIT